MAKRHAPLFDAEPAARRAAAASVVSPRESEDVRVHRAAVLLSAGRQIQRELDHGPRASHQSDLLALGESRECAVEPRALCTQGAIRKSASAS